MLALAGKNHIPFVLFCMRGMLALAGKNHILFMMLGMKGGLRIVSKTPYICSSCEVCKNCILFIGLRMKGGLQLVTNNPFILPISLILTVVSLFGLWCKKHQSLIIHYSGSASSFRITSLQKCERVRHLRNLFEEILKTN